MSKKYIEREAVLKEICFDCCECDTENPFACEGCSDYTSILSIPVADVEPVRHGKWIEKRRGAKRPEGYYYWNTPLTYVFFVCSECGRPEEKREPYCHCGAKMDKE